MLVAAPGKTRGVACKRLVEFVDFYPTLVDLCGLPPAQGLEGRSIRPLLEKPDAPWDHPAYTMVARNNRPSKLAVSTERYRLIENEDGKGGKELYDLQSDPHEWANLAANNAHKVAFDQLQKLATDHREKCWKYWDSLPAGEITPKTRKQKKR